MEDWDDFTFRQDILTRLIHEDKKEERAISRVKSAILELYPNVRVEKNFVGIQEGNLGFIIIGDHDPEKIISELGSKFKKITFKKTKTYTVYELVWL